MRYLLSALLLVSSTVASTAQQQPQQRACFELKKLYTYLVKQYGEHPIMTMTDANGGHLVVFTNLQTKTFTVIQFLDDKACPVTSGTEFNAADYKAMDEKYIDSGPSL